MKLRTGFLLFTVCFGWSNIVAGNPYVTEWWSKGVATVKNFVLGARPAPWHQEAVWNIEFDPEAGLRKSPDYQRNFGYRGERLVDLLGSGMSQSGNQKRMISRVSGPWMNPDY